MSGPIPPNQGHLFTHSEGAGTAGNEHSVTVPLRQRWKIHSIQITLDTDANAANRRLALTLRRSPTDLIVIPTSVDQTANTAWVYYWAPLIGNMQFQYTTSLLFSLGPHWILTAADVLITATTNIQAGDQYLAFIIKGERWIEP